MEPTGIEPVTSCLQSTFAEDLQKCGKAQRKAAGRGSVIRLDWRLATIGGDFGHWIGASAQTTRRVRRLVSER